MSELSESALYTKKENQKEFSMEHIVKIEGVCNTWQQADLEDIFLQLEAGGLQLFRSKWCREKFDLGDSLK